MKLTIEISTDNAAFEEAGAGLEVGRILGKLADKLRDWPGASEFSMSLRDTNGNTVGQCVATE